MDRFLKEVGEQRELRLAGVTLHRRRRRPLGEPRPFQREVRLETVAWITAAVAVAFIWATAAVTRSTSGWWYDWDRGISRWVAELRTPGVTDVMEALEWLGTTWTLRILLWASVVVLVVFRRWRHLVTTMVVVMAVQWFAAQMALELGRARPLGVEILGEWTGFSHPSVPVMGLTVTVVAMGYALVPAGVVRRGWFGAVALAVFGLGVTRVYLGVDHLSDVLLGALLAAGTPIGAFRLFVPDSVFPVSYSMGRTAHLDVGGARGAQLREALREQVLDPAGQRHSMMSTAMRDQLGCEVVGCDVLAVDPFGLAASAGSTPLRIMVRGEPDSHLFAKLYSTSHLRSDRWYKLGRVILYGSLEDERPFTSVRRLVEYEDYMLRVMHGAGVPGVQPYGIVELVPGREYLVVTEFLEDAVEIDQSELSDGLIDDALLVVRLLWEGGLAHRDVKPGNVLVHQGRVRLIDVAFGQVRPSPWREAIDLANMMLILGLQAGSERVYERALQFFSAQDIAEAFAATRGVTIPGQLRSLMDQRKKHGAGDLVEEFRNLGPESPPIAIQRWSPRRFSLALVTAGAVLAFGVLLIQNLRGLDLL